MANEKRLTPFGSKCPLDELPCGTLFTFGGDCIALESEYRCDNGLIEAHIIGSGEQFWGGAKNAIEQNALMVQPLEIVEVVRCKDCKNRDEITGECKHPKAVGWDVLIPDDNDFCSYGERKGDGNGK